MINIDKLTEPELVALNHRIVERLRFLSQMRAHAAMLEFRIGDRVAFWAEGQDPVVGVLVRYNKRTVTVLANDGRRWNVSPALLQGAPSGEDADASTSNVIKLKRPSG